MKEIAEKPDLSDVLRKLSSIAVHVMDTGCMRCVFGYYDNYKLTPPLQMCYQHYS